MRQFTHRDMKHFVMVYDLPSVESDVFALGCRLLTTKAPNRSTAHSFCTLVSRREQSDIPHVDLQRGQGTMSRLGDWRILPVLDEHFGPAGGEPTR